VQAKRLKCFVCLSHIGSWTMWKRVYIGIKSKCLVSSGPSGRCGLYENKVHAGLRTWIRPSAFGGAEAEPSAEPESGSGAGAVAVDLDLGNWSFVWSVGCPGFFPGPDYSFWTKFIR